MKSPRYRQAVRLACSLGLLLLPVGCYQVSVSFEPSNLETSSLPSTPKQLPKTDLPTPTPKSTEQNESSNSSKTLTKSRNNDIGYAKGTLRMSNQTAQPVRLALLARDSQKKGSSIGDQYNLPAHWDFAPQEGSDKGLLLSLPKRNLKLEKGDILVAFAQDGSRKYWGPYVVGETSSPTWNSQKEEWQLTLSP